MKPNQQVNKILSICKPSQIVLLCLFIQLLGLSTKAQTTTVASQNFEASAWNIASALTPSWETTGTGNNQWQMNTYTVGWTTGNGAYSPTGANSTLQSARFHSTDAASGSTGELITPSINLSTYTGQGKYIQFYMINPSGNDVLSVYLSTNGGASYGSSLGTFSVYSNWSLISIPIGNTNSSNVKIKFTATSDLGTSDIGIDEFSLKSVVCGGPGVYTVGPTGNFTSVGQAVNSLVSCAPISGSYIFELQNNYVSSVETFPITLPAVGGASATNTITIRPSASAVGRSITGSSTTSIFDFNGGNYWIIDGRPGGLSTTKDFTISNTSTSSGGSAIRFVNEGSNNIIRYTTLKSLYPSNTSGVVVFGSTNGPNGNDNNLIDYCDIDGGAGSTASPTLAAQNGVYSAGNTSTTNAFNSGNTISNGNVFNWYVTGATTTSCGILLANGNTDWTILANSFYQTSTRTSVGAASTIIPINITGGTGNNFSIIGNFIGGSAYSYTGAPWTQTGSFANRFKAISLAVGSVTPSSVQANIITNLVFNSASGSTTAGGPWCGVYISSGSVNMGNSYANTIGAVSGNGAITITATNAATSSGIFIDGGTTHTIINNTIGSITTIGTAAISHGFTGIHIASGGTVNIIGNGIGSAATANSINASFVTTSTVNIPMVTGIYNASTGAVVITNNLIYNLNNAYLPTSAVGNNVVRGIFTTAGVNSIIGNIIRNLSCASNASGTGSFASVVGIVNTSASAPLLITGNTIRALSNTNSSGAVWVTGISNGGLITGVTNVVSKNLIYGLTTSSNASIINGIHDNGANANYQNNMIALGSGVSASAQINGFYQTLGTDNFYHNTVYIGGNVSGGTNSSFAFNSTQTVNARSIRDNIFYNARSNSSGSGKHYAVRVSGSTLPIAGLTINNNIYFANGVGGVLGLFSGTDITTMAAWQSSVGQDASSFFVNPQLLDPTNVVPDLHINPSVISYAEGNGIDVGILDDYDAQTRSTLSPVDIGADAGNFLGIDVLAPNIAYTPLANSCGSGVRILTATITDLSGVPNHGLVLEGSGVGVVSDGIKNIGEFADDGNLINGDGCSAYGFIEPGFQCAGAPSVCTNGSFADLPVLYYKINGGAYIASQGAYQGGNTYAFSVGGGSNVGDIISYYIVAQDSAGVPNVGVVPSSGATGLNANYPSVTTPPTTPYTYKNLGTLTGVYTVGVGGNYPTLTAAMADYNVKCLNGNVVFQLTDPTYPNETFPIVINTNPYANASNTLTIKPMGSTIITGSSSTALIVMNGADYVTIDGSIGSTTNVCCGAQASRDLTIQNTSTSVNSAVVWLQTDFLDGATNNNIINCNIIGNSNTTTLIGIGSGSNVISISSFGTGNNNNSFINNQISRVQFGIYSQGSSAAFKNNGNTISMNQINSPAPNHVKRAGVLVGFENSINIQCNSIAEIASASSNEDVFGISLGTTSITTSLFTGNEVTNATIAKNKIGSISQTGTYSSCGIFIAPATSGTNVIANNFISGVSANSTSGDFNAGLFVGGGVGSTTQIYYNTITMVGTPAVFDKTFGIAIAGNNPIVDIRNNICVNTQGNGSGSHYALAYGYSTFTNLTSSNNNLYVTGAQHYVGATGSLSSPISQSSILNLQTATGKDAATVSIQPIFVSNSDLHLIPLSNQTLNNLGTPISITDDIDCTTRDASTPDMGADEYTPPLCVTAVGGVTSGSSSACNSNNGTITASGYSTGVGSIYQWLSATNINGPWSVIVGAINPASYTINPSVNVTTYYKLAVACSQNTSFDSSNVVTITVHPSVANISSPATKCMNDTAVQFNEIGGTGLSWSWSPAIGLNSTSISNPTANPAATTTYTVTVTSGGGCTATATKTLTVIPNPEPVTVNTNAAFICIGNQFNIDANGGTLGVLNPTWSWSPAIGLNSTNTASVIASPSSTTVYTVTATINGCSSSDTVQINVNPLPTATISGDANICIGSSTNLTIHLTGSAPWLYDLFDGVNIVTHSASTSPDIVSVNPTINSVYSVTTVYDDNDCFGTGSGVAEVNVLPMPTATLSGATTICEGSSTDLVINFTGVAPWVFKINDGGAITTSSNPKILSVNPDSTTSYTVTSLSGPSCIAQPSNTITVEVNHTPSASAGGTQTICEDGIATVSGATYSNGTILWEHDGAGTLSDETSIAPSYHAVAADAGHTVVLTMTVSNLPCPSASATYTVNVNPLPSATISGGAILCEGDSTELTIQFTGIAPWLYQLSDGMNSNSYLSDSSTVVITVSPFNTSTYTIPFVQDGHECSTTGEGSVLVTVNHPTTNSVSVVSCNQYDWTVSQSTYTSSGIYTQTSLNPEGCLHTDTLHLIINYSVNTTSNETACNSFDWHNVTYTTSGTYYHYTTGATGCADTATLNLTINYSVNTTTTETSCNSFDWHNVTYTTSGTYYHYTTGATGCADTATLNLTIHYSVNTTATETACNSFDWYNVTYTTSGTYYHYTTGATGCADTATLNLTINYSVNTTSTETACNSFDWHNVTYTTSGTYYHYTTGATGCADTATLNLTINYSMNTTSTETACNSYDWHNVTYTTSGTYYHYTTGATGCADTATLNLTINYSVNTTSIETSCNSYNWHNVTYTTSGTYYHYTTGATGCADTATLNLTINYSVNTTSTETSCNSFDWHNVTYTTSGTYYHYTTGATGCADTATLNLTINYSVNTTSNETSCNSFDWHNVTYTTSGTYYHYTTGATGCADTATLNLTINYSVNTTATETACNSYDWYNVTYTTSGTYYHYTTGSTGCADTATLNLTINYSVNTTATETACNSFDWHNVTYTTSGTYYHYTTGSTGCADTATLNLTINYSVNTISTETACNSFDWHNVTYTTSGTYYHYTTGATGCADTATLNLTINYSVNTTSTEIACNSFDWNNVTYTTSGTYYYYTTGATGCADTATLNLTINYSVNTISTETACNSFDWHNVTYTTSGTYYHYTTGATGCADTATLNLTINYSVNTTSTETACNSFDWNNVTYTTSGTYYHYTTGATGCADTATLNLTINYSVNTASTETACNSFDWHNVTYTTSGTYYHYTTGATGCADTATLNLTINYSVNTTATETACNSYDWHNVTYTTSGTYYHYTTGSTGCADTATLNLTINYSVNTTSTETACNSFDWNNVTYTTSGTYYHYTTGATGCADTATLNLTINYSVNTTSTETACNSFDWNNVTYTISGTYYHYTTGATGCADTATLNLTINYSVNTTSIETACNSFDWHNVTYTTSGTYYNYTTGATGCADTATLNLTINYSSTASFNANVCDTYTWSANGATYTSSGTYTHTILNASGCVHTDTLHLTITNSTTENLTVSACATYTWVTNGATYTSSGIYTHVIGCVTYHLNLTVNPILEFTQTASAIGCYTWLVNNVSYNLTGTYTYTTNNATTGCLETYHLNLSVTPAVRMIGKLMLQGPYDETTGLMTDSLREYGLIPTIEPYTGAPFNKLFTLNEPASETVSSAVLSVTGNDAIVDWIFIELRSASNPASVLYTKRALVQRDGDIVSNDDGVSPVYFTNAPAANYYVSVKHRNHLGLMTATPLNFSSCGAIANADFVNGTVYVSPSISITNPPRKAFGSVNTMWCADANTNKNLKYNGLGNDKDVIIQSVGMGTPNNILTFVYRAEDVNMDGKIKYNNFDNDRNIILNNVGIVNPNYILYQHTPN